MWRKFLSDAELADILENLSDDDQAPVNFESDVEDEDEEDHLSNASETEDVQEGSEELCDTPVVSILKFVAKDDSVWSSQPPSTGRVRSCNIIKSQMHKVILPPGKIVEDPIDAFLLFIDEAVLTEIASHTNKEAERVLIDIPWKPCDNIEIRAFLGLLLTAGHLSANDTSYDVLWSRLYGPSIFRATMGLKRFKSLLRFIRFDDKGTRSERRTNDKLAPIRVIWEKVNNNLKKHYLPGENITVDEQLVPFRGRCPFRQYMPSKPDKYGMKIWWACDSETYYPLNGIPYIGKEGNQIAKGLATQVVEQLVQPYYNTNRNVTFDNYFTDLSLAKTLLTNGLTSVGTVRKNKRFIPTEFLPNRKREEQTSIFGFTEKASLVSYVPKKNKSVLALSTMHHTNNCNDDVKKKPEIILYYNSTKCGVDTLDQLAHKYTCKRRTNRWSFTFFMNLLDVSGIAAYVTWMNLNPNWNKAKHQKRRLFLVDVSENLVLPHIQRRKANGLPRTIQHCVSEFVGEEATPAKRARTETKANSRRRCYMCPKTKDRKQRQCCDECKQNICNEHSSSKVLCYNCKK